MSKRMAKPTRETKSTRERKVIKMLIDKYEDMSQKYLDHKITTMQWFMFCENCLEELMDKNKKVLENLKNS